MLPVIFLKRVWRSFQNWFVCLSPLSQNSGHYANICPARRARCVCSAYHVSYAGSCYIRLRFPVCSLACFFFFFEVHPPVCIVRVVSVMFEKIRQPGTQTHLFNPVDTMPIYSWQIETFLGVGRNWLAASKMLEPVWIWNPLGSEPPERKKVFCGQGS